MHSGTNEESVITARKRDAIVTTGDHVLDDERVAGGGPETSWMRLFLARGADAIERDAEHWAMPLTWAEKKGHDTIATILRQHVGS